MIERDYGHVITLASIAGHIGAAGLVDYCASKYGAVGFNASIHRELRHIGSNVKTTCINPYYIDTGMFEGVKKSRFVLKQLLRFKNSSFCTQLRT
jgi:all-trans-retinol dehydrogenase (NAD+)